MGLPAGGHRDVVALSKRLYEAYLSDEDRAKVDVMGEGDAAYFWTLLYYEMGRRMEREILFAMEDDARARFDGVVRESATPFSDAEESVSPHAWFRRRKVM